MRLLSCDSTRSSQRLPGSGLLYLCRNAVFWHAWGRCVDLKYTCPSYQRYPRAQGRKERALRQHPLCLRSFLQMAAVGLLRNAERFSSSRKPGMVAVSEPVVITPNVTELVFEFVNCDPAEILVLAGGAIPPPVSFHRRCQPVLGSLLGFAAGIH